MDETAFLETTVIEESRKSTFKTCLYTAPKRSILVLLELAIIALYYIFRNSAGIMELYCRYLVRPYHRIISRVFSLVPFSAAELIYTAAVVFSLCYIIYTIRKIRKNGQWIPRVYSLAISLLAIALGFYSGYCLLWNAYYYGESFEHRSGIEASPYTVDKLHDTCLYFADLANEFGAQVERDSEGNFSVSRQEIFARSAGIYDNIQEKFPCLEGSELRAKPLVFSEIMSHMNFTGFFFPITAEANLNIKSPASNLPATIAHEMAHGRSVAMEQEANFVAVLASLESGDAVYIYSSALMAYNYLASALMGADYYLWEEVYESLDENVLRDMEASAQYWREYNTKAKGTSESIYASFLKGQGQTLGLMSYGACVDLLVTYYGGA